MSIKGVKDGDFTMVFGFPGTTEQFLTSDAVEHVIEEYNPMNIAMRDASLAVINAARSSSDELRIAYASTEQYCKCLEKVDGSICGFERARCCWN